MISVEDWAEIRRLHRTEQMPARTIARNTVRRAIADDAPPKYQRAPKGSIVDAVEPRIRELLEQMPEMSATVIAERIGWDRGLTVLKDRVRDLRPADRPADPASRTVYEPGEIGQCDLRFPPANIPLGFGQVGRPPVLVMVAGYSRWITARMLPSRSGADLVAGHRRLLTELGAVPAAGTIALTVAEIQRLLAACLPRSPQLCGHRGRHHALSWSNWRRQRQAAARHCHYLRRCRTIEGRPAESHPWVASLEVV